MGERYTSTGPPAARWPEPPRPHHRPRQGRRGRWSPRPRLDIRDWSCRGRCAHNPACAGSPWPLAPSPVPDRRDGREHRARGARTPGHCTPPAGARRIREAAAEAGEAESPASGFATIRVDSLMGDRPAMTPIGRLILCLGWIRRLEG